MNTENRIAFFEGYFIFFSGIVIVQGNPPWTIRPNCCRDSCRRDSRRDSCRDSCRRQTGRIVGSCSTGCSRRGSSRRHLLHHLVRLFFYVCSWQTAPLSCTCYSAREPTLCIRVRDYAGKQVAFREGHLVLVCFTVVVQCDVIHLLFTRISESQLVFLSKKKFLKKTTGKKKHLC